MRLALFQPDIAGNVGTILRLGACLGVPVDLIEPMGFAFGDRALARAGMDYAQRGEVVRHPDWAAFAAGVAGRVVLLGSESAGVPGFVHDRADLRVRVPMRAGFRSLNVAVAGAMVLAEALRQTGWPAAEDPLPPPGGAG